MPDRARALVEDDNGALVVVASGGIKRLVDGKLEPYPHSVVYFKDGQTAITS